MKFSNKVTYSRRKNRKNHFHASSNEKRKTMVSPLSKELWKSYSVSILFIFFKIKNLTSQENNLI